MFFLDIHTHSIGKQNSILSRRPEETIPSQSFSLGIHPWYLKTDWADLINIIEQNIHHPHLQAIGECGFDLLKGPEENLQLEVFAAQAKIAKKHGLPVILHCVKGLHLLQAFLKRNPESPAIIWHGYNQKPEVAKNLLARPVYFSFGEALMKEGSNAQKFIRECPLDRIFFETDTSDVEISSIYKQASVILGLSIEELVFVVRDNWNHISKRKLNEG
ncbi:TatD family hydrolase [Fontibacter flavus]|uniref:TatD family hydrolase n=1 Tax=Fontibacter flavus TaxID=654838 RepID=A0ABV6FTF8_9BACT